MSSFSGLAVASRSSGPPADPLGGGFQAVAICGGRLAVALLNTPDVDKIANALDDAKKALTWAESRRGEIIAALEPATDGEIEAELTRLVRAWPQDKRGDLAGYGAELTIFMLERQPSRRALEQACRSLKLGRVHLPSIAEVMTALDAAEGALASVAKQLDALPGRIAKAKAVLERARSLQGAAEQAA